MHSGNAELRTRIRRHVVMLLSFILVMSGIPDLPAFAEGITGLSEQPSVSGVPPTDPLESPGETQLAGETEPSYEAGTLEQSVTFDAGGTTHHATVTVTYDEDACVPAHATLLASAGDMRDPLRQAKLEQALRIGANDQILSSMFFEIRLECDGQNVSPSAPLTVDVSTDLFDTKQAASVEVAHLPDSDVPGMAVDAALVDDTSSASQASATLRFSASTLGQFALASVATRLSTWREEGLDVSLLGPRYNTSVSLDEADAPPLEEGAAALRCVSMRVESSPTQETCLWVSASQTNDAASKAASADGGVYGYAAQDGRKSRELFGPEGTSSPVALSPTKEQLLLVWDSGYRKTTLKMDKVTVEGMMPEGTSGVARDMSEALGSTQAFVEQMDQQTREEVEVGTLEFSTLAAYDITLRADGQEYEPDPDHPLEVTLSNEAFEDGTDLQLWHIHDDGTRERVERFERSGSTLRFEATGFSTYAVLQQRATATTATSTYFTLRAEAKTYARSSKVTFVDTNKNPIAGTVLGTITRRYNVTGPDANDENRIDLHTFADKLDPSIADEYDFSRVYVQLAQANQKDFRYVHVADGTAITPGRDANTYRAFFYYESIEQNKSGGVYNGTWYNLGMGGAMNDIFIEFFHVAPASFYAIDTRDDPVEGAEFTLYTDSRCYTPFEYKNSVVKATSDRSGLVSFGKIPQGTYYMKETQIPETYKTSTKVYTVVVDGATVLSNVVHEDDDGSVVIADTKNITIKKEWDDGNAQHQGDSVEVTVFDGDTVVTKKVLSDANDWTCTVPNLDPNTSYMVSESKVTINGQDKTSEWIPHVSLTERDPHSEYYKADSFVKGRDYALLTATATGMRALASGPALTTLPLAVNNDVITETIGDNMLWNVEGLTSDNVISLKNVGSNQYLDHGSKWFLNASAPQYVRHLNDNGSIRFYYRVNLNNTNSYYLYVHYNDGRVDRYFNDASKAAVFEIYRKVTVKNVDVTISNKTTRYPLRIQNVSYPNGGAVPGMEFALYDEEDYVQGGGGTPRVSSLVAGSNGFLASAGVDTFDLGAGTYYLVQTKTLGDYAPLTKPVKFTITRGGALKVLQADQEVPFFSYGSTYEAGGQTYPLLRIPHYTPVTVAVTLDVRGAYANRTKEFEFSLAVPEGIAQIQATVNGVPRTFSAQDNAFALAHGQQIVLKDVPASETYVLEQAASPYVTTVGETSNVEVVPGPTGTALILSNIVGTAETPARATIVNTLPDGEVLATGVDDNANSWHGAMIVSAFLILACLGWQKGREVF